ncbi:MAG: D-alanine--D-alanine ligase [Candidatus Marinimicrobia bacterium]|nr:D-alanine--D-alanine ligase [Candidatus Neomarinimicrobiota bacterium]|tara:strand:+ start:4604 stop:5518 length:915 start_codon:yes stop_codon:yes gene_type:complete
MRVAVVMGGNSSERLISIKSGNAVVLALEKENIEVFSCIYKGNIKDYISKLKAFDVVFLALHGGEGENGKIQEILERENIVYTGSKPKPSALAMDKSMAKKIMVENNIPTPAWRFFEDEKIFRMCKDKKIEFDFPFVVKPNSEGSTLGLTIVKSSRELDGAVDKASSCNNGLLFEEYIPGRELAIGVLGNKTLPCVEIIPSHDHYDFDCKYQEGMSKYICPAELSQGLANKLAQSALSVHEILGCSHYSRIDFRLTEKNSFFCLEINTLPGLTQTSLLPMAATAIGINFSQLIKKLCRMAIDGK